MKERRGWLWLASGILLALIAGLLTFQIVSDLAVSASMANETDSPTVPVIVAMTDIPAFTAIATGMVTLQDMPVTLVPQGYSTDIETIIGKFATTNITAGEILLDHRLADPTNPNTPLVYTSDPDKVVVTIPASALLSQLNMLAIGDRIDVAYTLEFEFAEEEAAEESQADPDKILTSFLSLQNLEVKGVLRRSAVEEGIESKPEALLVAVSPQEALIVKYLVDAGAPMDIFLRSPRNEALSEIVPVDEQYLIDYFQLDLDVPVGSFARSATSQSSSLPSASAIEPITGASGESVNDRILDEIQSGQGD